MSQKKVDVNYFAGCVFLGAALASLFTSLTNNSIQWKLVWLGLMIPEIAIALAFFFFSGCRMIISEMRKMQNIQVLDELPSSDFDPDSEPSTDTPE